jgi:hypothetical protein
VEARLAAAVDESQNVLSPLLWKDEYNAALRVAAAAMMVTAALVLLMSRKARGH